MEHFSIDVFQDGISSDLVSIIWDGGFLDYDVDNIHQEIDDILHDNFYYVESLKKLLNGLRSGVGKMSGEEYAALWNAVGATEGLSQKIMATLSYFMDCSKRSNVTVYMKESSILAATTYMTMLRMPGYSCIQLFHPVLFQKSLDSLKTLQTNEFRLTHETKSQQSKTSSSRASQKKSQSGCRGGASQMQSQGLFDETSDDLELSEHDRKRLRQHLVVLLQSVVSFLKVNPLKNQPHLSEAVISLLSGLTTMEPACFVSGFDTDIIVHKVSSICHLAYVGMLVICTRNQGTSVEMVKLTFSSLESNLLMFVGQKRDGVAAQTIPKETVMIRDQTLTFILHLMSEGKDSIKQPVQRLLRSIILSTPDRSEYRVKVTQAVLSVMGRMSDAVYCDMCSWLYKLSKYKKASGRMMSVEIYGQLLVSKVSRNIKDSTIDQELVHYTSRPVLLQALLTRCSDKVPSVAAKALTMLASCLNCEDHVIRQDIRAFITPRSGHRVLRLHTSVNRTSGFSEDAGTDMASLMTGVGSDGVNTIQTATGSQLRSSSNFTQYSSKSSATAFYLTRGFDITLTDSDGLISLVTRRMQSMKAVVRRSALLVLENIIIYNDCIDMQKELDLLRDHCRDIAVPIRKQAVQSLTQLLQRYPDDEGVRRSWLTGVLPAQDDNESSVQEKCWQSVKSIILDNINPSVESARRMLAWTLCSSINTEELSSLRNMLYSVCTQLYKTGNLPSDIIQTLSGYISSEHSKDAWMLLSIICPVTSTFGSKTSNIVATQWLDNCESMEQPIVAYVLTTLATLAQHMSPANRGKLINDLTNKLRTYRVPIASIKYMVVALAQLMEAAGEDGQWVKGMMEEIEDFLTGIVYAESYDQQAVEAMPYYLITLGEICLHNPLALSKRLIQVVQCLLLVPKVEVEKRKPGFISDLVDGLLPLSLRRAVMHCIGQICLQQELVAKQSIPILARELEISTDSSVKKTIVIVLCDLCKLYTNSIGPYISSISTCLRSRDAEVCRSAFIGLTRLLQEDFLKWKGSLFYKFISCIVSHNPDLAALAKQTFIHELSKRHSGIYTQHFVECLYHFNDFTGHKSYNRFPQTDGERALFSLAGQANFDKRQTIYCFMLDHMVDSQKFTTTERLCQDIIAAAVEKELPINTVKGAAVLVDALTILQSKNIKLTVTKASTEALIDGSEDITPSQAKNAKVAAVAVSKILKKNFVEMIIPDIISLKSLLEADHSPIMKHLMLFLIEVTKDYKEELQDILAGNEQLAAELAFDIKKFEEMEAAAQLAAETSCRPDGSTEQDKTVVGASETPVVVNATPGIYKTPIEVAMDSSVRLPATGTPAAVRTPAAARTPATAGISATPRPPVGSGTPAMPPPPLRSALKKPMTATRQLINTARKMAKDRELSGQRKTMGKRVNFDEEEENDEQNENLMSGEPSSPLQPMISGAVGSRAISTPDGHLADVTFAANMSMVQYNLSPIAAPKNLSGKSRRHQRREISSKSKDTNTDSSEQVSGNTHAVQASGCPLANLWKVKSPVQHKEKSKRCRPPPPVDMSDESESITLLVDPLVMIPVSTKPTKPSISQRRSSGRKRK